MKIAMIGQKGMPAIYGGVEAHVHDLSVGLVLHGHAVIAYARRWYTGGKSEPISGVEIRHVPTIHTKHLDAIVHTFLATINAMRSGVDVIHYHGVGPALLSWIPRVFSPKTKVIVTFHSIDRYHQKWGLFARLMLKAGEWSACHFPHLTVAVSQGLKQYCLNEYGVDTVYIPNGVNAKTTVPDETFLRQFHLEKNNYIVMISRLVPHKGAHILIEAFNQIKKKYATTPSIANLKLAIVGGSVYTDRYVESLHTLASETNGIVFTDFQSDETLEALYAHARLFVHPSFNEGLPMTVLTAMSHGQPALLSRIPEHIELVTDSRCLFSENNVQALTDALADWLLRMTPEESRAIGEHNRSRVETHYSWNKLIPHIVDLYRAPLVQSQPAIEIA